MIPMIEVARISRLAFITAGAGLTVQLLAAPAMQLPDVLTIAPATIDSAAAVSSPQVRPGAVDLQPVIIPVTSAASAPSLSTGAVAVAPAAITAASIVRGPAVSASAPVANGISPLPIGATSMVGTPALIIGAVTIAPLAIASASDVRTPTVSAGAVNLAPTVIAAASAVHAPTVAATTPAQSVIAPPAIASISAIRTVAVTIRPPQLTDLRSIGGNLNGLGYATTDTDNGVLYFYVSRSPVAPSVANIKSGSGAARSEGRNATSAAEYSFIFSLADANPYYPYFLQTTSGGLDSAIAAGPIIAKMQTVAPTTIASTVVPTPIVSGGQAGTYDPASQAYFAAMTVQPDTGRKTLIDTFIKGLIADGTWNSIDRLMLLASHDAQAALVDVRKPTKSGSAINGPAFTVDRGFQGDGASSYVSMNENIDAAGNLYSLNDHCVGAYINLMGTGITAPPVFGQGATSVRTLLYSRPTAGSAPVRSNCTSRTWACSTRVGHFCVYRNTSSEYSIYLNGALSETSATPTISLTSLPLLGLRDTSSYSADRQAALYAGSSGVLPPSFHTRLNTFLTAIGANV